MFLFYVTERTGTMILTAGQEQAIKAIKDWYLNSPKQVFKMSGAAGTGKSTVVAHLQEALNLGSIQYAVFTGKGAHVLNKKGIPAITIHRLIYDVITDKWTGAQSFHLKGKLDQCSLVVIDEGSMVGASLYKDLLSFGVKVLIVGDDNQLPPVQDTIQRTYADVTLSEITRQAKDSPIIRLSQDILNDTYMSYGKYAEGVLIVPRVQMGLQFYTNADQIICAHNKTRRELNRQLREDRHIECEYPVVGDKLICLRNEWKSIVDGVPLMNGMLGVLHNIFGHPDMQCDPYFCGEFLAYGGSAPYCRDIAVGCFNGEPLPSVLDKLAYFDYGYAITCHKAQGSEFDKVAIYVDYCIMDRKNWLYTAVTRAKQAIVLGM